jgi:hypothetical protein
VKIVLVFLLTLATCTDYAFADATRPLQGTVILVHGGNAAIFLWNATPYVAQLVVEKTLGDDGMRAMEGTAVTALAAKAPSSTAATVSLRVLYEKTAAVSPAYGGPTLQGMENVMTLTADRKQLTQNATAWATSLQKGSVPSGLKVEVTGALPPAQ